MECRSCGSIVGSTQVSWETPAARQNCAAELESLSGAPDGAMLVEWWEWRVREDSRREEAAVTCHSIRVGCDLQHHSCEAATVTSFPR